MGLGFNGLDIVAVIEIIEIEFIGGFGRPEPQVVDRVVEVARNRRVVRHGQDILGVGPDIVKIAVFIPILLHMAVKLHRKGKLRTPDFPGVSEAQPVVGLFHLVTVGNALIEYSVFVTDSVTVTGDLKRSQGIKKAGRKAPKAPVAEAGIHFRVPDILKIDVQLRKSLLHFLFKSEIQDGVSHKSSDQKFQGKIIDALGLMGMVGLLCLDPAVHQTVANGVGKGKKFIIGSGGILIFGQSMLKMAGKTPLERFGVHAVSVVFKRIRLECQRMGIAFFQLFHTIYSFFELAFLNTGILQCKQCRLRAANP